MHILPDGGSIRADLAPHGGLKSALLFIQSLAPNAHKFLSGALLQLVWSLARWPSLEKSH
ncbi:hypothetical protein FRC02_007473, partial [Tulasnella sp. 418]